MVGFAKFCPVSSRPGLLQWGLGRFQLSPWRLSAEVMLWISSLSTPHGSKLLVKEQLPASRGKRELQNHTLPFKASAHCGPTTSRHIALVKSHMAKTACKGQEVPSPRNINQGGALQEGQ